MKILEWFGLVSYDENENAYVSKSDFIWILVFMASMMFGLLVSIFAFLINVG